MKTYALSLLITQSIKIYTGTTETRFHTVYEKHLFQLIYETLNLD